MNSREASRKSRQSRNTVFRNNVKYVLSALFLSSTLEKIVMALGGH